MFSIHKLCFHSKQHQDAGNEVKEIFDKENSTSKNPASLPPTPLSHLAVNHIALSSSTQKNIVCQFCSSPTQQIQGMFFLSNLTWLSAATDTIDQTHFPDSFSPLSFQKALSFWFSSYCLLLFFSISFVISSFRDLENKVAISVFNS